MERKEYEFKFGKCYQEELTLGQDIEIAKLISELDVKDLNTLKVIDLITTLATKNLITKFLKIILLSDTDYNETDLLKLNNKQLTEVISDFFIINPSVKNWLETMKNIAGSTNQ